MCIQIDIFDDRGPCIFLCFERYKMILWKQVLFSFAVVRLQQLQLRPSNKQLIRISFDWHGPKAVRTSDECDTPKHEKSWKQFCYNLFRSIKCPNTNHLIVKKESIRSLVFFVHNFFTEDWGDLKRCFVYLIIRSDWY